MEIFLSFKQSQAMINKNPLTHSFSYKFKKAEERPVNGIQGITQKYISPWFQLLCCSWEQDVIFEVVIQTTFELIFAA